MKNICALIFTIASYTSFCQCDELDLSLNGTGYTAINAGNQSDELDWVIETFVTDSLIMVVGNSRFNSIKQGVVAYFDFDGKYLKKTKVGTSQFISNDYTIQAACLQHDGKLLVTGHVGASFNKGPVFIARLNEDGSMDQSYGNAGIALSYLAQTDFNYMSNIVQEIDGSITAIGRGREHNEDLIGISVSSDESGDLINGGSYPIGSLDYFKVHEFIGDYVFELNNRYSEMEINFLSGSPTINGVTQDFRIDINGINGALTGLSLLSNDRLAAYGYMIDNDVRLPIVYIFNEDGNLDTSFNGTGYKMIDRSDSRVADIVLYNDVYYLTTRHTTSGVAMFKLNLDGTFVHHAWSNPSLSLGPLRKGGSIYVQDSTFLVAGEVYNNGQSDFGLIKYKSCDYKETVFEEYPLKSIRELKRIDEEGLPVLEGRFSTYGVVSSINFSSSVHGLISIMDYDNEGIFVSGNTTDFEYFPQLGDEILVSGSLQSHFDSRAELFSYYYRIESKDNPITTPIEVNTLDYYIEGVYIQINNVTLSNPQQWKGDGTTFTVDATDGTNFFDITIHDTSYWSDKPAPQGTLTVSGIGSQNDSSIPYLSNFEVYPQTEMDIKASTSTIDHLNNPITLFPNPSSTYIQIENLTETIGSYSIYDIQGKQYQVTIDKNKVNVSLLEDGMYFLVLRDGDGIVMYHGQFVVSQKQ